jgi:hypothetical protein
VVRQTPCACSSLPCWLQPSLRGLEIAHPRPLRPRARTIGKTSPFTNPNLGKGFTINGDVLSSRGCIRLNNARVEHWQADAEGMYVDRLRAYQITGVDGRFRFETEWPGLSPPHTHFMVTAPGHKPLVTQWVGERPLSAIHGQMVLAPEERR